MEHAKRESKVEISILLNTTSADKSIEEYTDNGSNPQTDDIEVIDVNADARSDVGDSNLVSQIPKKPRQVIPQRQQQHHHQQQQQQHKNNNEYEYIDVVWLKKDVRWSDHGPLSEVAGSGGKGLAAFHTPEQQRRRFVVLYLYEPDQLKEHSVHGSHLRFVQEGLVDMEGKLKGPSTDADSPAKTSSTNDTKESTTPCFEYLTVCHNTIISTLNAIHFRYPVSSSLFIPSSDSSMASSQGNGKQHKRKYYKIARLLAHEETGHWQSYMRDRSVRKWCKTRGIPFMEFNQTGVTRRLKLRDDYLKLWKTFMAKPLYQKIDLENADGRASFNSRLIQLDRLPGFLYSSRGIANLFETAGDDYDETQTETDSGNRILGELPAAHRSDRRGRQQFGGETRANKTLISFLSERGVKYSQHISSPNSSWNSCSRLSVYLTWGHISLRCVLRALEDRRDHLRKIKTKSTWLRSLQAFGSRAHWRSHFVQKLESEPTLEKRDLCPAYQHLRRQERDWDPQKYISWETGTTGYPFVDACMRCLIEHGWLNFRMRAMLVSFATYNLWLDWKRIAPHLARVFLDYEPGIHYPQLQMQAGTTGINAMRVYNVTKQGKDQDPKGFFIRRYVPELRNVPDQYIHEPWKMSESLKEKYYKNIKTSLFSNDAIPIPTPDDDDDCRVPYPEPIVDEKESARIAKEKLNAVKKAVATRAQANQIYIKHGSRSRQSNEMNQRVSGGGALPAVVAIEAGLAAARGRKESCRQPKIKDVFTSAARTAKQGKSEPLLHQTTTTKSHSAKKRSHNAEAKMAPNASFVTPTKRVKPIPTAALKSIGRTKNNIIDLVQRQADGMNSISNAAMTSEGSWSCTACTFLNYKPHGLVCSVCGTER